MKYTFGKSIAAERLEALLEYNPRARRKIASLLSVYTHQLLMITQAKDPRTVRLCMELLRDYTLRRLDVKSTITHEIRSYAKNIVLVRYRAFRKGFDYVTRTMKSIEDNS